MQIASSFIRDSLLGRDPDMEAHEAARQQFKARTTKSYGAAQRSSDCDTSRHNYLDALFWSGDIRPHCISDFTQLRAGALGRITAAYPCSPAD